MRVSTSLNVLPLAADLRPAMARVRAAGFDCADLNLVNHADARRALPFSGDGWRGWVEQVALEAEALHLPFNQAHGSKRIDLDGDVPAQLSMAVRQLEAASLLKIPRVVFHAGKSADAARLLERNRAFFMELCESAARPNVEIALENTFKPDELTAALDRHIALIDALNTPLFGACWDTGHAHIAHADQRAGILALGRRLRALHIQDGDGVSDTHTAPYYGMIDWENVMRALADADYRGDLTFEAPSFVRPLPDALKGGALRQLCDIGRHLSGLYEESRVSRNN